MSATEQTIAPAGVAAPEVIRVRVPPRSWRSELRAMKIVWRRELIRFRSDRIRIVRRRCTGNLEPCQRIGPLDGCAAGAASWWAADRAAGAAWRRIALAHDIAEIRSGRPPCGRMTKRESGS